MTLSSSLCRGWRWIKARFSFHGRATRTEFWLSLLCVLIAAVLAAVAILALHISLILACRHFHKHTTSFIFAITLPLLLLDGVLYLWAGLAVSIRRTHDLGLSYRDSLRIGTNIAGGFKRGTIGPNPYGPDPLQKATPAA